MFSWPISLPFVILHADLWLPGYFTHSSHHVALMNVIRDMTQFVIVVPLPNETTSTLAEYFMQHVIFRFVICHLNILDVGSPFKDVFPQCVKH